MDVSARRWAARQLTFAVDPDRRAVDSRRITDMHDELHITSLVVHSTLKRYACVSASIASIPGAMVHATSPAGKLVVTLEASTGDEMMSKCRASSVPTACSRLRSFINAPTASNP